MKQVIVILCLLFLGPTLRSQSGISNLSFENWSNTILGQALTGWFGTSLSQQNSGAQHGNKYVRVSGTSPSPNLSGFLSLGGFIGNSANSFVPYTQRPLSLNGFYRCGGMTNDDSVGLISYLKKSGNLLNYDYLFFKTNTSDWTSFSLVYTYFDSQFPDSLSIWAMSNPQMMGGGQNTAGTYLELDNLSFSLSTSLDERSIGSGFLIYPNPTNSNLFIVSKQPEAEKIMITDMEGRLIEQQNITDELTLIHLVNYNNGFYLYTINDAKGRRLLTGKFLVIDSN